MIDPAALLDQFEATLKNQVALIEETARSSPAGGGPQWAEIVRHFGLPDIENRGRVAGERKHPNGAFPDELETVVSVLAGQASQTLDHMLGFGMLEHRPDLRPRVEAIAATIASLAATQRKAYTESLAPKRVTGAGVGSIFANVKASKQINPWADLKYDRQFTLSCPGCGAPQQVALEFVCRFCGCNLFGQEGQ